MPNWTAEQQRAIDANGNLLVSAGAGSGKTAVLTARIVRLIRGGESINSVSHLWWILICGFLSISPP